MAPAKPQAARAVLEDVVKRFGQTVALDGVSLTVEPGELVTLLGPSGCGKTTALRILAGLETVTAGRVFIGDAEVTHLPPNARDLTMVFQSYALFPHLSVFENVAYGLRVLRRPEAEVRQAVREVLGLVGMPGLEGRSPSALSGGQQQRVAVARAIVLKPKVLLFDEPLSNLDAKLRKHMRAEIRSLQQRLGITALYVTHDQAEALAISDRIAVMEAGRIRQLGRATDIYARPATRFVADFIGEANFLPARVTAVTDGTAEIEALGRRWTIRARGFAAGAAVVLVVRPEAIAVGPPSRGRFAGEVTTSTYLGGEVYYDLAVQGASLQARVMMAGDAPAYRAGDRVGVDVIEGSLHIVPREG